MGDRNRAHELNSRLSGHIDKLPLGDAFRNSLGLNRIIPSTSCLRAANDIAQGKDALGAFSKGGAWAWFY